MSDDLPNLRIRNLGIADLSLVIASVREAPGVSRRDADTPAALEVFLARNPGLSVVAETDEELAGFVLVGHDGRCGYLHHLVVRVPFRRQHIATTLVSAALERLRSVGINEVHVDVLVDNEDGLAFWHVAGWQQRDDLARFSITLTARDPVG